MVAGGHFKAAERSSAHHATIDDDIGTTDTAGRYIQQAGQWCQSYGKCLCLFGTYRNDAGVFLVTLGTHTDINVAFQHEVARTDLQGKTAINIKFAANRCYIEKNRTCRQHKPAGGKEYCKRTTKRCPCRIDGESGTFALGIQWNEIHCFDRSVVVRQFVW